jgi:hypothetical protein
VAGYIKLYRDIQEHWIWQGKPFSKGQAWIDLLMAANHDDNKVVLGNEIILVERGCLITSEVKLAKRWGWSRHKVRDFLDLLKKDSMIVKKSDTKRTYLNIVNYSVWQDSETAKGQQKDSKRTAKGQRRDTNKNDKNDKNDKNISNADLSNFSDSVKVKIEEWLTYKKERKETYKPTGLKSLLTQIQNNITTYGEQKVIDLISECMAAGYKGIIWDKLKRQQGGQSKPARRNNFQQRDYDDEFYDKLEKINYWRKNNE